MSSTGFWSLIFRGPFAEWFTRRTEAAAGLDPERISVENVRSILGVPFLAAKLICEAGVREGTLIRRHTYFCPNRDNHRLIVTSDAPLNSEEQITCEACELSGDEERSTFSAGEVRHGVLYAFRKAE